jgi:hypothetical protein
VENEIKKFTDPIFPDPGLARFSHESDRIIIYAGERSGVDGWFVGWYEGVVLGRAEKGQKTEEA